ncbi:hypothetical protein [Billgrantia saliphila]|uniref:hypothetical protein n=1 Tax=Billgrantia saliphila TaxID=1848458 RepID=UPI001E57564C|nr:hypothetical protein [Halomonas saliphila]
MSRRDEFVERMKAQLDEWNVEIDELAAKARRAGAEAQTRYHEDIERLMRRRDETRRRLEVLQFASEAAWESLQEGLEDAWELMRKALRDAYAHAPDRGDDGPRRRSSGGSP